MRFFSIPRSAFAIALAAATACAVQFAPEASGQTGSGWVTLFDGKAISDDWARVGQSNWRVEDGAIVADRRTGDIPAHLVTKAKYKDFQVYVEFWASDDANSGVFLRCQDPAKITDRSCYEVNIFDQRKDPTYGTGGIVNFVEVNPMPKAGGKWNTFEITAKGTRLVLVLNGVKTVEVDDGKLASGPIALQWGRGTIRFRKVEIRPL